MHSYFIALLTYFPAIAIACNCEYIPRFESNTFFDQSCCQKPCLQISIFVPRRSNNKNGIHRNLVFSIVNNLISRILSLNKI